MEKLKIEITLDVYNTYASFSEEERALFQAAKTACLSAYAPYSRFKVGAAVLMADGSIYPGNNQENAAYPSGLCAERVALFYAGADKPEVPVKAIAVTFHYTENKDDDADTTTADDIPSPCGACRQVIAEYEHKFQQAIKICLLGKDEKVIVASSMQDLLPLVFSAELLGKYGGE